MVNSATAPALPVASPSAATTTAPGAATSAAKQTQNIEAGVHYADVRGVMTESGSHAPRDVAQLSSLPPHSAGLVEVETRCTARTLAAERALCRLQHENDLLKRREVAMLQEQRSLRALATRLRAELQAMGSTVIEQTVTMKAFANEMERRDPYHLVKAKRAGEMDKDELARLRAELTQVQLEKAKLEQQHSVNKAHTGQVRHARGDACDDHAMSSPERIDHDEDEVEALMCSGHAELRCLLRAYDALFMRLLQHCSDGDRGAEHVAAMSCLACAPLTRHHAIPDSDEEDEAAGVDNTLYNVRLRVLSCHQLQLSEGGGQDGGEIYVMLRGPLEGMSARTAVCKVSRGGEVRFVPRRDKGRAGEADCSFRTVPETQGQLTLEVWGVESADRLLYRSSIPVCALLAAATATTRAAHDDDSDRTRHAASQPRLHTLALTPVSADNIGTTLRTTVKPGGSVCIEVCVSSVDATLLALAHAAVRRDGRLACVRDDGAVSGSPAALPLPTCREAHTLMLEVLRVVPAASHSRYTVRKNTTTSDIGIRQKLLSPPRGWLVVVYDEDGDKDAVAREVFRTHVTDKDNGGDATMAQAVYHCHSLVGHLRFRVYDEASSHCRCSLDDAGGNDGHDNATKLTAVVGSSTMATRERPWRFLGTRALANNLPGEPISEAVLAKDELSRWGGDAQAAVCARVLPLRNVRLGRTASYGDGDSARTVWGTLMVRCCWVAPSPSRTAALLRRSMSASLGAEDEDRGALRRYIHRLRRQSADPDDATLPVSASGANDGVVHGVTPYKTPAAQDVTHRNDNDDDHTPRVGSGAASVPSAELPRATMTTKAAEHNESARGIEATEEPSAEIPPTRSLTALAATAMGGPPESKTVEEAAEGKSNVALSPASSPVRRSPNVSTTTHAAANTSPDEGETSAKRNDTTLLSTGAQREGAEVTSLAPTPRSSVARLPSQRRVTVYVKEGRHLMENGEEMLDVLGTCDPRVRVWRGEELLLTVPEVHAALQPRWPREVASCTIDLEPTHTLRFEVQDVQVMGIDPMGTASIRGEEVLRHLGEHELVVRLAGKQYGTLLVDFSEAP